MFESSTWSLLAQAAQAAKKDPTFFEQYQFYFSLIGVIALFAICWAGGQWLARNIRLPEYGTRLAVIITTIVIASLLVGLKFPPKFGVDLRGGMNLVGSIDTSLYDTGEGSGKRVEAKDIIPQLLRRVDPAGLSEIMIRPLGQDKIEVEIPSVDAQEAKEIWKRLTEAGHLQFRIVADSNYPAHANIISEAIEQNASGSQSRIVYELDVDGNRINETTYDENGTELSKDKILARWFALAREDVEGQVDKDKAIPIKFVPGRQNLIRDAGTGQILQLPPLPNSNAGKALAEWCKDNGFRTPQILMLEPESERSNVEGKHIKFTRSSRDERGRPAVSFTMTNDGARRMNLMTTLNKPDQNDNKKLLGIVLDEQLHSAPSINSPITEQGEISGRFTTEEVRDLIIKLDSGKLDVALNKNPISMQFIESHLGNELKTKGLYSILGSFVIVLIFMVIYYRFAGFVACGALFLNLLFIMALVMSIQQPLTLTGLAGLVLTIGMSVDANVLIFERIREELERGSGLRMAINNGFDKATTTIVDANVTTLITAIVLYVIGTEQIKGFSVTLILGILMSMFTAIYCAKTVFLIAERKRWITKLNMMRALTKTSYNFIGKRFLAAVASIALICCGLVGMYMLGPKILNHDLRGGSTARVVFNKAMEAKTIREKLDAVTNIDGYDEELEFTVSKLTDPDYIDRVFKIDSNLATYDGKDTSPYKDLAGVLSDTFEGDLTMLSVDIGKIQKIDLDGNPVNSTDPVEDPEEEDLSGQSGSLNRAPQLNGIGANVQLPSTTEMLALLRPASILTQDDIFDGTEEAAPSDASSAVQDSEVQESDDEAAPGEEGVGTEAQDTDDLVAPGDEGAGESEMTDGTQTDPLTSDSLVTPDTPLSGGTFGGSDLTAPATSFRNKVAVDLTFGQKITGKALRTILAQSASELDISLTEEQIDVLPDDIPDDDDNVNGFPSQNWKVTFDLNSEDDVQTILGSWSSEYNETPYFPTTSGVGGQIASDTQWQALGAIIASLLGIIAYVWIRFQNVAFGLAAVVALIHDVLIVLGAIAITHFVAGYLGFVKIESFKISLPVVAALLTIIGYSLNDTIVVFDRIREVRGKRSEISADMINTSICQTLSRTILTSVTTFIVVFILYWFGGDAIHGFAFSLVIGVIVGTYSSIFVASPTLLWLMNTVGLNPGSVAPAGAGEK